MTQEQLAEMIGRSTNFVSTMEHGQTAPSFETLERLAKAFQMEVIDLFRFDEKYILTPGQPDEDTD
jgi:transcriptional regulator with XRE-family HTH domain